MFTDIKFIFQEDGLIFNTFARYRKQVKRVQRKLCRKWLRQYNIYIYIYIFIYIALRFELVLWEYQSGEKIGLFMKSLLPQCCEEFSYVLICINNSGQEKKKRLGTVFLPTCDLCTTRITSRKIRSGVAWQVLNLTELSCQGRRKKKGSILILFFYQATLLIALTRVEY